MLCHDIIPLCILNIQGLFLTHCGLVTPYGNINLINIGFAETPVKFQSGTGISLSMRPANEWRRYNVTTSLIDWAHA